MTAPRRRYITVEDMDGLSVVRMVYTAFTEECQIDEWGRQLFALVDELGMRQILLDFSNVEFMGSPALGKLITLARKTQHAGGQLILCGIARDIYEVFEITRLNRFFTFASPETSNHSSSLALARTLFRRRVAYRCPLPHCGTWFQGPHPLTQGVILSQEHACPDCGLRFEVPPSAVPTEGEATWAPHTLTQGTYPREQVRLRFDPRRTWLTLSGRLDLFAMDIVAWLWEALPSPRALVCSVSGVTEISRRGAEGLLHLPLEPDDHLVLTANEKTLDARRQDPYLGPFLSSEKEATEALAAVPENAGRPPTVQLRVEK